MPEAQLAIVVADSKTENLTASDIGHFDKPLDLKTDSTKQKELQQLCLARNSTESIAKSLRIGKRVVAANLLLMGSMIINAGRIRSLQAMQRMHHFLQTYSRQSAALQHVTKHSIDEFKTLRVRVSELPRSMPKPAKAEKRDSVAVKLMQVIVEEAAVWEVDSGFLEFSTSVPTYLKPMQSGSSGMVKAAVCEQVRKSEWVKSTFPERGRVSIGDGAGTNELSDYAMFAADPMEKMYRWICDEHKGQRLCELQWACYPNEQIGMMAATVMQHHAGTFGDWKRGVKEWFRERLDVRDARAEPEEPSASNYRMQVEETFSPAYDQRLSGPRARTRQIQRYRRRKLINGNTRRLDRPEHLCRGPGCCQDRNDTLEQINELVDAEERPDLWALNRWLGVEVSTDFHGYYLSTHGLYVAGFYIGIIGVCAYEEVVRQIMHVLTAVPVNPADAEFLAAGVEASETEKQSVNVKNTEKWLHTKPLANLFILKRLMRTQQRHQKDLLDTAGTKWDEEQYRAISQGKERTYRPLLAFDGTLTMPYFRSYSKLLFDDGQWEVLPLEVKSHQVAADGFRGSSRSICAHYQLIIVRHRQYPTLGMGLLSKDDDVKVASQMIWDYENRPCVMTAAFHDMVGENPHIALLLQPRRKVCVASVARLAAIENAPVEANNASVRRWTSQTVQCAGMSMEELNARWALKWSKAQRLSGFGDPSGEEPEEESQEPRGGGGGSTQRAFFSRNRDEAKEPSGRVNFKQLWEMYHREAANPNSEEMRICREMGRAATKVSAELHANKGSNHGHSSFGTIRPRDLHQERRTAEDNAMLMDYESRSEAETSASSDPNSGVLVVLAEARRMDMLCQVVTDWAGRDLRDQIQALDRLCRAHGRKEAAKDRQEQARVREFMNTAPTEGRLPWHLLDMPEMGKLRYIPGRFPLLRWHDPLDEYTQRKAADLQGKQDKVRSALTEWLERVSRVLANSEADPVDFHDNFKPTYCHRFGGGTCLCAGDRVIIDIMRRKSIQALLLLCPSGSESRKLLSNAFIFACFQGQHWYHIGLVYYNPQRPTYLKVDYLFETEEQVILSTSKTDQEEAMPFTDVEVMETLDMSREAEVRLFRLMAYNEPVAHFTLGNLMYVEELGRHSDCVQDRMRWWKGRDIELAAEIDRRRQQARRRTAAAAKAAAKGAAKAAPKPRPAPGRRQQKPRDAGLPVPADPPLLAALQDGVAPAAGAGEVRLTAEGIPVDQPAPPSAVGADDDHADGPVGDQFADDWQHAMHAADDGVAGVGLGAEDGTKIYKTYLINSKY